MKILYVTDTRLPTEKAHGLSTVKLCEAFARLGFDIELLIPKRAGTEENVEAIWKAYGVRTPFTIRFGRCLDLTTTFLPERFSYPIRMLTLAFWAAWRARVHDDVRDTLVFSHDSLVLFVFSWFRWSFFYDIHHFPSENIFYRRVLRRMMGCAVQTQWKVQELSKRFCVPQERMVYWPNGTEVQKFEVPFSREEARTKLNLPLDQTIVLYTGQLFSWKGVDTLVKAVEQLPASAHLYLVGGSNEDIERFQAEIRYTGHPRIHFIPFQPHERMPLWLRAANVVVLPNTAKQKVSLYYTSPMKLFEYMASGTPIVASRIPSILEIVDDTCAFLAEPDQPVSFAECIEAAITQTDLANEKAAQARARVQKYTWEERAKRLIAYFSSSFSR